MDPLHRMVQPFPGFPVLTPEIPRQTPNQETDEQNHGKPVCFRTPEQCKYAYGNEQNDDIQQYRKAVKFPFELFLRRQVHYS